MGLLGGLVCAAGVPTQVLKRRRTWGRVKAGVGEGMEEIRYPQPWAKEWKHESISLSLMKRVGT
jgi:hypothetical protein